MRQYFADTFWLQEHIVERIYDEEIHKRINHWFRESRWNVQKMRSESNEHVRKQRVSLQTVGESIMALESYFEERVQEICTRNWMNLEMQTALLNTYLPKLIATIPKALREQLKETDQLNAVEEIAGPEPEIPLEYDQILKEGQFCDDVNGGYLPQDLVLVARREEIEWVHSERCLRNRPNARMQESRHETVGLDLGGHRQVGGSSTQENQIKTYVQENTRRRIKVRFKEFCPLLSCSLQCRHLKLWRCLFQSWCQWICRTKESRWNRDTMTSAEHISEEQLTDSSTSDFPQRIVRNVAKT